MSHPVSYVLYLTLRIRHACYQIRQGLGESTRRGEAVVCMVCMVRLSLEDCLTTGPFSLETA